MLYRIVDILYPLTGTYKSAIAISEDQPKSSRRGFQMLHILLLPKKSVIRRKKFQWRYCLQHPWRNSDKSNHLSGCDLLKKNSNSSSVTVNKVLTSFIMCIVFKGWLIAIANPCPTELNKFFMKIPALYLVEEEQYQRKQSHFKTLLHKQPIQLPLTL